MTTRVDLAALRREAEFALRHYAEFDERVARESPEWVPRGDHIRNWYQRDDEALIVLIDIVEAVKSERGFPQRRYDSIRGEWICCHCESTWEFKSHEWHRDGCPGTRLAALLARIDTGEDA